MNNNVVLISKAEALAKLPFGRRGLDSLIKKGEIGFKKVNGRYYFLESEIERWANDLEYHTASTPEVAHTGHTSRCKPQTEKKYSLGVLVAQKNLNKLSNSVSRKLQSYRTKQNLKPQVNFQA
jgi:hypothetical protein